MTDKNENKTEETKREVLEPTWIRIKRMRPRIII